MRLCFIALCGIVSISLNLLLYECIRSYFLLSLTFFLSLSFSHTLSLRSSLHISHFLSIPPSLPSASPFRPFILYSRHRQLQQTPFNYLDRLHFLGCIAQPFPQPTENNTTLNMIWSKYIYYTGLRMS